LIDIWYQFTNFVPKMNDMKIYLSQTVKKLCTNQNMTLKDLANMMGIAPESLSRTLNGNPQLATLENIAKYLDVDIRDLFPSSTDNNVVPLHSIIVYDGVTYISDDLEKLINNIREICTKEGVSLNK
jgi:transcriptional regulator with XRE-family HTH domain